jgi:hypothetical protein
MCLYVFFVQQNQRTNAQQSASNDGAATSFDEGTGKVDDVDKSGFRLTAPTPRIVQPDR